MRPPLPLSVIFAEVCREFGVTPTELRFGTQRRTRYGRPPAALSVSLARYTFLWRAWQSHATATATAEELRATLNCVYIWFRDFKLRRIAKREEKTMAEIRRAG